MANSAVPPTVSAVRPAPPLHTASDQPSLGGTTRSHLPGLLPAPAPARVATTGAPGSARPADATSCPVPTVDASANRCLQPLPAPLPVRADLAAAATDVLTSGTDTTAGLEHAAQLLANEPGVDSVTIALTLRRPEDHEQWTSFGGRAWLRQFRGQGHAGTRPAHAGQRPLSLPYLSQAARAAGVVALPDTDTLSTLGPLTRTDLLELRSNGIASMLSAPLLYDGVMFGAIALNRDHAGTWSPDLAGGLRLLAAALAARLVTERSHDLVADAVQVAEDARATQQQFFRTLGHELRTPIAAIIGTAELLSADLTDLTVSDTPTDPAAPADSPVAGTSSLTLPATGRESMVNDTRVILSAAEQLTDVIDELLSAAQLGGSERDHEPVALLDAAHDVTHWLHAPALTQQVTVSVDVDPALRVYAGGGPLRQVLSNLIGNAIAYNHHGGHVHVRAEPGLDLLGAPRVRVTVEDNGPGLSQAQAANVFTPFVRFASKDRPGTGLGLALSRTLVERFGGQMGVEPNPDGGCSFWFELPACA